MYSGLGPLEEASRLLDRIIDDSLDCQERIYRRGINDVPDFAQAIGRIINLKDKVTDHFYKQLES